jgi:glycosyltransferase involved in cell wall biosynthesis
MKSLVSIIIPCYNAEDWIAQAIQSALDQTWLNKEIIVIDDGSKDGSLDKIKAFDTRVRWESGPNRGASAARNRGVELARGNWIQFLDADDVMLSDCVTDKMTAVYATNERICCDLASLRGDSSDIAAFWNQKRYEILFLIRVGAPQTSAPLHRREDILKVGAFRSGLLSDEESDMHLRMAIQLGITFVSNGKAGVLFRQRKGSLGKVSRCQYPVVRREVLLNALDLLKATGQDRQDYRDAVAQGIAILGRELYRTGRREEAIRYAKEAKEMSNRWYEGVYKSWPATVLARTIGFSTFEFLHTAYRTFRGKEYRARAVPFLDERKGQKLAHD